MTYARNFSLAVGLLIACGMAQAAEPLPIDAYTSMPAGQDPRLSPDGNSLAMISPVDDRQALVITSLDDRRRTILSTGDTLPDWFHWKTSNRLLASLRFMSTRNGTPMRETRLVFVDADGKNAVNAKLNKDLPAGEVMIYGNAGNRVPQFQDRVVNILPDDPQHLLMAVTPENDWIHPQILKVDIQTGRPELHIVARDMRGVTEWLTDSNGSVRAAVAIGREHWNADDTFKTVLARTDGMSEWQTIFEGDTNSGKRFNPVGFDKDSPSQLYVLTDDENGRLVARKFDILSHSVGEIVESDPHCDIEGVWQDSQLVGFVAPCRKNSLHYLDAARQHDRDAVAKALKTDFAWVIDRTADGKRALVGSAASQSAPATFWLLDRRGEKTELSPLGGAYPKVTADSISPVRKVEYAARDGLKIPAFLTMPIDHADGPVPFVVLVHGGPTAHDSQNFNWMVQYLVSRGYGVLQPQFRGSSGFGNGFRDAGFQQWGKAMQDDVTDGTHWLIDQKLADPARIAIIGANYGGYSALMGIIKEPQLYACAAAFAPITDMDDWILRLRQFAFKDINIPRIKAKGQDLDDISPIENIARIRVPVLLVHGRKDFSVPVSQSEEMERALKRAGKPVEAIYLENSDHFMATGADRLAWLSAVDRLLAANMKPVTMQN